MGQYFEDTPTVARDPNRVELVVGDRTLSLTTDTGVFSRHRVDAGTAVLLRKAPPPPESGALLDLGCGYGPIACALAVQAPAATVWALDVNERARELTVHNAAANDLPNVVVAAPDNVPPDVRFAALYSNPPVRVGKDAMYTLVAEWLGRLEPADETKRDLLDAHGAGHAFLVVQRHLGSDSFQQRLQGDGWVAERLASSKGYRVLAVAGRAADPAGGADA